jgi:hypothetical protein
MHRLAKIAKAKTDVMNLLAAIDRFEQEYGKPPVALDVLTAPSGDFTYGTFNTSTSAIGTTNTSGRQANNSEVIAVLVDLTQWGGKNTVNTNYSLNPKRIAFLNVRVADDTNSPGLGPDGIFRDPWANPYVITIHFGDTNKCRDAFYRRASVSENGPGQDGLNGFTRPTPPPYSSAETRDSFEGPDSVMIWSLGPDGKADPTKKANEGVNRDNITSW